MSIIVLSIISLIIVTSIIYIVLIRSKECEPGFSGKNCKNKSEGDGVKCIDNICGNNGRCEEFNFRENYKCTCNPGFTGDNCEKVSLDCRRRGGGGSDGGRGGGGSDGGRGGRGGGRGSGRVRGPICGTWTEQTMFDISQLAEEKNGLVARDVFDKHAVKFGAFTAEQITNAITFVKDNKVAEKCRECGIPVISNSGNEGCSVISGTPELTPCLGAAPHYSLIAKAKTMSHSSSYIATVMLENVSFNGIDAIWRSL